MSADDNNEQSVMLSLDDLLAQDPSLGKIKGNEPQGSNASSVDQKAFDQIGLNQNTHRPAAPLTTAGIPLRHGDLKTKGGFGKVLGFIAVAIGVVALVGVGVFIGSMNNPNTGVSPQMVVAPQPQPISTTAPVNPTPTNAVVASPVNETSEPKPTAKSIPKAKAKSNRSNRRKRPATKVNQSPKPSPLKSKSEPKPQPQAKARPIPRRSEASSILSSLKSGKSKTNAPSIMDDDDQPESNLPSKLGQAQIIQVIRKNRNLVAPCGAHVDGQQIVKIRVVIAGSGKIKSASFYEPPELKGSKVANCIIKRVKLLNFPAFSSPSMRVTLPFRL